MTTTTTTLSPTTSAALAALARLDGHGSRYGHSAGAQESRRHLRAEVAAGWADPAVRAEADRLGIPERSIFA
jgi:hypothetical protein